MLAQKRPPNVLEVRWPFDLWEAIKTKKPTSITDWLCVARRGVEPLFPP
jgi:hypothetical protein